MWFDRFFSLRTLNQASEMAQLLNQQHLRDVRLDGISVEGKAYLEKYISPSAEVAWDGIPDDSTGGLVTIEETGILRIGPPVATENGGLWACNILFAPVIGNLGMTIVSQGQNTASNAIITKEPNFAISQSQPDRMALLGTRYRLGAASITTQLDASALNNQGTAFVMSQQNPWKLQTAKTNQFLTVGPWADVVAPYYTWSCKTLGDIDSQTIMARPGTKTRPAREGDYTPLRNREETFKWMDCEVAWLQSPTSLYELPYPLTAPVPGWDMVIQRFEGLHPTAGLVIKYIACWEIQPDIGSPLQSFIRATPVDHAAMALAKAFVRSFDGSFPADYNDWATLWNGVKATWNAIRKPLTSAVAAIPGYGPALSAAVGMLPEAQVRGKQSKKGKQSQKKGTARPGGEDLDAKLARLVESAMARALNPPRGRSKSARRR